ncbi:hypothetical protein C7212DRAFT_213953 [Tuber magnatum]|uniref:HECT-type E3 ubiquitin transferase n=1 Tax=Tuber magnatum TaxID=42249 RepID=A0A317SH98_9PEZI|nr:hypothetical protein C7212DRAFT_213953 [Tuber magnatum]
MKIKKTATAKHEATLSPFLKSFIATATSIPIPELLPFLSKFPVHWPFPRGDLYHWIALLNRFDSILEEQVQKYKLKEGPQTILWERQDEELVIGILKFSRMLVENCGNRSLYGSSGFINDLLNTTSLDVLEASLRLGSRLAQRYHTSRTRGASQSTNAVLLASHYNINLERVSKLATPFLKSVAVTGLVSSSRSVSTKAVVPIYANDLARLARDERPIDSAEVLGGKGKGKASEGREGSWEEWGGAYVSYYVSPTAQKAVTVPGPGTGFVSREPVTPTPARRTSLHHGHQTPGSAHNRRRSTDDAIVDPSDPAVTGGMQTLEIPYSQIKAAPSLEDILKSTLPEIPVETHYDLLHRLRVASALAGTTETRRQILGIRILALTNLAYVYSENQFTTKILQPDQDEPRRFQLVYQLAELVHSGDIKGASGDGKDIPRWLQTLALGGLEALARHKSKTADVCAALSVNVNHGVLLYVVRKAVEELAIEKDEGGYDREAEEWREALFTLVGYLPTTAHAGSLLVSAGLIPILVELLQLRTKKALRNIPKAISFLDSLIYNVQNAFQALASARGLDVVVDLVSDEVAAGLEESGTGKGIPDEYKSSTTDFKIGFYRQQTLKMVFKFMQHMMAQSGGNADRLLRNLIDSPRLLSALKVVVENGTIWGSNIWSTVVGIASVFIHNEPTSYAVIHEAGLSHALLETVTGRSGLAEEEAKRKKDEEDGEVVADNAGTAAAAADAGDEPMEEGSTPSESNDKGKDKEGVSSGDLKRDLPPRLHSPAAGIMPSIDSIGSIPTAFGAICLNASGLALFQTSGALETFFEIFESADHVKCLTEHELASVLGSQFDELVRHHPVLRENVMKVVIDMLRRVEILGRKFAEEKGMGAKLWIEDGCGGMVVAGGRKALVGRIHEHSPEAGVGSSTRSQGSDGEDVEMGDADVVVSTVTLGGASPDGAPKVEVVTLSDIIDEEAEDADRSQPSIVNFIDAAGRFLEGFLANANLSKDFIKRGGLDFLLDFYTIPSLPYDFATSLANQMMSRVLQACSENSPLATVEATLGHAQKAIDQLQPLLRHDKKEAFFAPLTDQKATGVEAVQEKLSQDVRPGGTTLIKDLVTVHSLCYLLRELYGQPLFNVRLTLSIFMQPENEAIVSNLGALHRMCVWEEILLQNAIPDTWNEATRVKNSAGAAATSIDEEAVPAAVATSAESQLQGPRSQDELKEAEKAVVERDGKTPWFRNVKTIRFLISQIPSSITPFLQGLARSLISRRGTDLFHKQHAFKIAEAISESMYDHLTWKRLDSSDSVTDKYGYWIVMLTSIASLLFEEKGSGQVITITLVTFKQNNGIRAVTDILETFWGEVQDLSALGDTEQIGKDSHQRMAHAYGGIKIILSLFTHLVSNKSVLDSTQTAALQTRERSSDTPRPDFFNPHQFLVELRASILPVVRNMWDASSIEKASCSIVKSVIEILGIVLKADSEGGAFTRKELEKKGRLSNTISWRTMGPSEEDIRQLVEMGFTRENAMAGLLRGNGNVSAAAEWLTSQGVRTPQRGSQVSASSSRPLTAESHSTDEEGTDVDAAREEPIIPTQPEGVVEEGAAATESIMPPPAPPAPAVDSGVPPADDGAVAMNIDESDARTTPPLGEPQASEPAEIPPSAIEKGKAKEDEKVEPPVITIEDLDGLRSTIRDRLIDRSLDVLRVHSTVTFELSSLLTSAFGKASESPDVKKEVASTILQSLMSLQADDDLRPCAKTITSTSHLLGLVLQNQDFFDACLEDLKEQIPTLIGFIKMNKGEPAPWIASILLVVEKVLSESAQPKRVTFTSPPSDQEPENIAELNSYKISDADQDALFGAVMGVVSVIGRDEVLPLAVARVLVLLTRKRELAIRMTEGDNLRDLFHMLRCQAGLRTERIQASIMLVLRHIIEDPEVLKAIMRNEIRAWFQSRGSRQTDTQTFVRHNHHLVLRDPDAFVELANELCKLTRYEPHSRTQQIAIKETERPKSETEPKPEAELDPAKETEELRAKGTEDKEMVDKPKPVVEVKPPGLENPDGVIHFLLSELLASKDEMDNPFPPNPPKEDIASAPVDVQMEQGESAGKPAETSQASSPPKLEKPEFKAEQHPMFIYRCFILQALTELLSCYNRTKIEFIGFSRKAAPRDAITPSKPRSAVLNYLLNDIIPLGTLIHTEDIAYKKRATTSQWAILAIVSLSAQTGESSSAEDESNLLFVRKFILESALKAFKDSSSSVEPLDAKYSRMMSLTDLFFRMLSARPNHNNSPSSAPSEKSQQQIARIMFEKNFIAALTGSLADIDLNFPSARRVIKYILRPLKLLSKTATDLNEISSISTPGATDEDEISTATSISDIGDMREDTPDLYRNSTLGMFEGEMVDDEHSSYDEDDYDDEMDDDEMELEEEMEEEGDSEISDEEAEEGGEGMDVEIVVEAGQESEDDDGDDGGDDDDSDDMDDEVEILDEMAQDQVHYGSGGEEDWQSEGSEGEEDQGDEMLPDNGIETIVRAPGGSDGAPEPGYEDRDDGFIDDDAEDDDDDDDDDDMDEEEPIIQEDYEDDGGAFSAVPWGWADETGEAPMMARAHPRGHGGWYTLGGPPRESPVFTPRATDNVDQNPLLQQNSNNEQASARPTHNRSQEFMTDWVQAIDGMHAAGGPGGTVSMISTLMSLMTRTGQPVPVISNGGSIQFQALPHIAHHHHHHHPHAAPFMPRELRSMFEAARPQPDMPRHHREDPQTVVNSFIPTLTTVRWTEESRLLFGTSASDRAQRVVNAILVLLVPPAIEEDRITKEKQEKARLEMIQIQEERKKKEEEERIAREKAEEEERIRKEAEEREAAERAAAEAAEAAELAAAAASESEVPDGENSPKEGEAMEGVEATQGEAAGVEAGPSDPPAPRATVMIRGREMDITGMDIDPGFLEALPEELREEVLTQHIRERRAAAATNDQPSEISREFLEALPDEIRDELLAQEAADRRRRERDQARPPGASAGPADLDLASFLATLEPDLRQTVLLEQDDESLAQLPQAIVAEANQLRGERRFNQFVEMPRVARVSGVRHPGEPEPKPVKKPLRKSVIQLLDKAGVATLLRLMFIPQVGSTRITLHEILLNICENRQNRAEVVNLLLSILQDGSSDMAAVERSFAQLSVRAKQVPATKTPTAVVKRTGTGLLAQTSSEVSPLMVAQQCLGALLFLVSYNEHIPSYFLNEHDISVGLKRSTSRKGKGKEVPPPKASKYALNTLLSLLDRRLITESSTVMDQLSVLLSDITRPLTFLLKREKRKPGEQKPADSAAEAEPTTTEPANENTTAATETSTAATAGGQSSENKDEASNSDRKKDDDRRRRLRHLVPPVVPEHNLRLVVNILTARECSSKTFRETLATMQNLSAIPEAKVVFGAELIRQAQVLGGTILGHLEVLVHQIKHAENGTEIQGMALSNFSPASSDQAKLLRVLTALDYLFDPKRPSREVAKDSEPKDEESKKERDVLSNLYESLTFGPLWSKLSQCLSAIHERSDMLHVATILLPLIEALMVVCKNSGLKEAPRTQRGQTPMSPVMAEASMENLFFRFTEDHRKILNQMVRNNPKLMSGSFALLVHNPKVLEFDNKRNYFNRRLHTRQGNRDPHPTLQLNVRRDQVFLDSYKSMYYKNGDEIKYAKLSIRFHGEEGVDAGGVTREWFQVMARQMFNPDYALFIPVASDRTTFHPSRMSGVNPEHLSFFKFIGRIIGKALYEGRVLDCHFSRAVYKRILGKSVSLKDMETLDLDYYKSLVWMHENDITDIITETFSVETDDFGDKKIIDLVPDGRNVPVTEDNKHEYVRLLVEYRLLTSVQEQMENFLVGFHDIVPAELISIFNEQELELLISGLPEIDVDDWRNNTEYHNYSASSPQIQWFWRAVRSFDKEERAKLLQFVTGTSKVPLNGFKELEGMNGFSKFNIHRDYGSKDRLPSSHTCFNQIDLPEYDSYENLRQNILTAITQGAE